MNMQELEITIDKEGQVQVRVREGHGPECLTTTKNIENALGEVQNRDLLSEYYEQPVTQSAQEQVDQG
jgi:hypothetical protein